MEKTQSTRWSRARRPSAYDESPRRQDLFVSVRSRLKSKNKSPPILEIQHEPRMKPIKIRKPKRLPKLEEQKDMKLLALEKQRAKL